MHELTNLDLVIIVLYMIGMLFVGVWFVKRIKNTGDYYVAGRTLGPFVLTATVCASIIGGSAMMGRAGIAYTTGFKAVMTAIPYLIGMFIFSAIAGRIQEVGFTRNINSIPELFNYRFNSTARCILAFMIVFTMMGTVAAQVTATAPIIKMNSASAMKPAPWRPLSSSSSIPLHQDSLAWCTRTCSSFSC